MKIVIDDQTVWLDEQANDFLESLKSTMTTAEVEGWLMAWFEDVIVPAMMGIGIENEI